MTHLSSCFKTTSIYRRIKGLFNSKINIINATMDLANWMGDLIEIKRNTPINLLAIPGSHDSMTYGISRTSKIAPDAEPIVKGLAKYLKPIVNFFMYGWSVTQSKNVTEQLNLGIRYLDLRIATNENDTDLYFVHGLYGDNVKSGLSDIKDFLSTHIKEIVIIDFQHFYNFNHSDHQKLINLLVDIFGDKLCPSPLDISLVTLNWMFVHNYQVIAIYRNSVANENPFLWTSNMWSTPWPDTMNVNNLLKYLEDHLAKRPRNIGYVSQCVLTPQKSTVIMNPFCGVKSKCAIPVTEVILPWIHEQSPALNVAIADYVEINAANFPLSVISLNYV